MRGRFRRETARGEFERCGLADDPFPLTPALSLGERETAAPARELVGFAFLSMRARAQMRRRSPAERVDHHC
jgi:hypothetical protein